MAVAHENARLFGSVRRQATKLARAEAGVRALNTALEQRVQERTAELEAANKELEAFSHSVAHDLRGPLRAIDDFSSLLADEYGARLDDDGHSYIQRVRFATRRMSQLIDDLLQLSRVTRVEMRHATVDLRALAQEIGSDLQQNHPGRQVEFHMPAALVTRGDAPLLQVALENLLGSAWKFTSKRPSVVIEFGVKETADKRIFFVRDNGAGFMMVEASRLFNPFMRLHRQDEFPGTGIGLAITQRIIHCHGGHIWAEGVVDQGATFYFTLPDP
jgi:light-regulated signal transduction histidine kinase (bacteriophytochrome)